MPEIKFVWIQTRPPRGDGDPGACEIGHYYISDGVVVMCREDGKPTGKKMRLGPSDDAQVIAGRLTREVWFSRARESDFNRPLIYSPNGVA